MADNNFNNNPIVVTTVGSLNEFMAIRAIHYTGATTTGHGFTLTNFNNNRTIATAKVSTSCGNVVIPFNDKFIIPDGITVSAIDSGTLLIYKA